MKGRKIRTITIESIDVEFCGVGEASPSLPVFYLGVRLIKPKPGFLILTPTIFNICINSKPMIKGPSII